MNFKNQIVRDLAWVIGSPPLMQNIKEYLSIQFLNPAFFKTEFKKFEPHLLALDENPEELEIFLNSKDTTLLGKYFESLVEYWLLNSEDKEILLSNYQIIDKGNTKGELDFIYKEKSSGSVIHLEVAGKFYLGYLNVPTWSNFIGPNNADRLSLKMDKFLSSKHSLGRYHNELKSLLGIGSDVEISHKIFFKGYIFYHINQCLVNNFVLPENSFKNHLKGWWFTFKEKDGYLTNKRNRWFIPRKNSWMPSFIFVDEKDTLSSNDLKEKLANHFSENKTPVLLVYVEYDDALGYKEKSRGFVVPDNWPFDIKNI